MFLIPQNHYAVCPESPKLHFRSKNISPFLQPPFSQTEISHEKPVNCILKLGCLTVFYNISVGLSAMISAYHHYQRHFILYSRETEQIRPPQSRHVTKILIYDLRLAIT